jgi:hypothetical protein
MRKSKAEAAETRQQIIDVAAHEFRLNGIHETGYVSVTHRDDRAGGCPLAGLGSELARADDAGSGISRASQSGGHHRGKYGKTAVEPPLFDTAATNSGEDGPLPNGP